MMNTTKGVFLTLATLAAMLAIGSGCKDIILMDADHNVSLSTLITELEPTSDSYWSHYCWNITTLDGTPRRLTCQVQDSASEIGIRASDEIGGSLYYSNPKNPFEIDFLNGRIYMQVYISVNNIDTSLSCAVYSVSDLDTLESICGPSDIELNTGEYHISLPDPFNIFRAQCHWQITRPPGTIIYLDLLHLDIKVGQELAFGRGLINGNSSTLTPKEINNFNYKAENGSSYFFLEPHLWISYSSQLRNLDHVDGDTTTQILRLRLQNYTSRQDVQCDDEYVLCLLDSKCVPQSTLCDGVALCSDFTDEAGNCDHCGISDIPVHLNEPVTIIGNFSRIEGTNIHSGYFTIIYGATAATPNATTITTHHVELNHGFECVWHLTEPPGTRLKAEVLEFEESWLQLSIGGGNSTLDVPQLIATETFYRERLVFSTDAGMWVTLKKTSTRSKPYLRQLQIVFNSYPITDCGRDSFSCPSGQGCLVNSSHVCNGMRECPAYADELGCGNCEKDYFQCASSDQCIPKYQLCDGYAYCEDHTDEYLCGFCGNETIQTRPHEMYQIKHSDRRTDCLWVINSEPGTRLRASILAYRADCEVKIGSSYQTDNAMGRGSYVIRRIDNRHWQMSTAYPSIITANTSTMWITKKCLSRWGEELFQIEISQYTDVECGPNELQCPSGLACINPSARCDNQSDCPEGWDELGCGNCGEDEMRCRYVAGCVSKHKVCDGNIDCADYSDEFNCEPCGESIITLQQDTTVINSQGWSNDSYQNRLQCLWMIIAQEGYRVVIIFKDFETEEGYDFLRLGNEFTDNFLNLTGTFFPESVTSSGNTISVMFTSDFVFTDRGFSLQIQQKPEIEKVSCAEGDIACPGTKNQVICVRNDSSERGLPVCANDQCGRRKYFIHSEFSTRFIFPQASLYPNNINCLWKINGKKSHSIWVSIRRFQTERFRDKLSIQGSTLYGGQAMRFKLHGTTKIETIVFNQSIVNVEFASDSSVAKSGFDFRLFGNFSATNETSCPYDNLFDCGDGSCLSQDARCDGFVDCQMNDLDESGCESVSCPDFFHCANSTKCIYWDMVCDDKQDCPLEDDETDYQCLKRCPSECSCNISSGMLDVTCKDTWNQSILASIPTRTKILSLFGGDMMTPDVGLFKTFSFLRLLSLVNNNIDYLEYGTFDGLQNLTVLRISDNPMETIRFYSFYKLQSLQIISIQGVSLRTIESGAFDGLVQLNTMILTRGSSEMKEPIFVEPNALRDLTNLETLYVDDYRLCCDFAAEIEHFQSSNCKTTETQPPLNLCGSLMRNMLLRVCIWCLGLSALIGNAVVIVWRCCQGKEKGGKKTHSFFVLNLAISDLMMGVYMVIIASADISYGDGYSLLALKWRSSAVCKIAGVLSMLSSEASVFFITLISVDCFLSIVFPFSRVRINEKSATILVSVIWMLTVCLSVGPTAVANSNSSFYGLSDVCIGLPLTTVPVTYINEKFSIGNQPKPDEITISLGQGQQPAWQYSIILFLGINSMCFLVVLCCYITIFAKVKSTVKLVRKTAHRKREIKMAVKMALIVGTDFACWMPVIILGILSQTGIVNIGPDIYAWVVVFILPINSSLNPYLYTLYTMIVIHRNEQSLHSLKSRLTTERKTKSTETLHSISAM